MTRIVAFGEVMARLKPAGQGRLRQALPGTLEVTFGGAEANVAVSLAILGADAAMVTALPRNPLGDACVDSLRGLGVDTRKVLRTDYGRLGLYFVEAGANQRPSVVVYDREHSSVSLTPAEAYAWDKSLAGANWLHLTGITPSLSRSAAEATIAAAAAARTAGATVSCDLNFRKKLWQWEKGTPPRKLAEATMRQVLAHTDLLVANEEDCADVLGIHASHTEVESGKLDWQAYPEVAREVSRQFPQLRYVSITLRQSISATHNNWAAMLYSTGDDKAYFSPLAGGELAPYEIRDIVDRVGAGDAFGAGLIFALTTPELAAPQTALAFATAASCLAHSILGDFNYSSRAEIEALMRGSASGRVVR